VKDKKDGRKCVVKDKIYDFYYQDGGNYVSSPFKAIFEYNKIPENIKKDPKMEIIFLDTKEGLELLAEEKKIL
jgi:hypothetical protein